MISIIIPIFNAEQYLENCLESVMRQSYKDFECILVDDGSNDNSLKICQSYSLRDQRFRVFHKSNGGVSSARNVGIEQARGEYLYFIDSDDALFCNALEVLLSHMNDGIDLVFSGYVICDNDGKEYAVRKKPLSVIVPVKKAFDILAYPQKYYITLGMPWINLFRKSIIWDNNIRYDERFSIYEDLLFLTKYMTACGNGVAFYNAPSVYLYYYKRPSGIMNTRSNSFQMRTLLALDVRISILKVSSAYGLSSKMIFQSKLAVFYTFNNLIDYLYRFNHMDLEYELREKVNEVLSPMEFVFFELRDKIKRIVSYIRCMIAKYI